MQIEDDELRDLYKTSSSEHLQKLESKLMQLEKNPRDTSALEEFLREAHTLKGDSRMLGLNDIEMLVHQLEDCIVGVKQGKGEITPQLCDRLYRGIDAVNQLAHAAITGEESGVDTFEVLALLMGAESDSPANELNEDGLFDDDDSCVTNQVDSESFLFDDDDELFDDEIITIEGDFESSFFADDDNEAASEVAESLPQSAITTGTSILMF